MRHAVALLTLMLTGVATQVCATGAGGAPMAPAAEHGAMTVLHSVPVQAKVIALTFDLGCSARRDAVEGILLSLDKRGAHCTWFLTGWLLRNMPDLVPKLAARGDDLANHTDTHPHCRGISSARLQRELQQVEQLLAARGYALSTPKYFRPPFGEYNERVMSVVAGLGYRTVLWSATTTDYDPHSDPSVAASRILRRCRPGGIILMHATGVSRRALPLVLDGLTQEGYEVTSLSALIHVAHAELTQAAGPAGH